MTTNTNRGGKNHGWPKTSLSLVLYFLTFAVQAEVVQSSDPAAIPLPAALLDQNFLLKVIVSIVAILIAQAAIPAIRGYLHDRRQRKAFLVYIKAHVRNTLASYGEACSTEHARNVWAKNDPGWLQLLDQAGLGAPEALLFMHKAIAKAETQQAHEERYIPFLSYFGISSNPLDHTSPIWDMSESDSKQVSEYLISQEQILTSLTAQYEDKYFKLIESDSVQKRTQWCEAAYSILEDMAEHYINAIALRKMLNGK